MSLIPGLPDEKPETATEVTEPIHRIEVVLNGADNAAEIIATFGEGETVSFPTGSSTDVDSDLLMFISSVAHYLSSNELVWCDLRVVARRLAEAGL